VPLLYSVSVLIIFFLYLFLVFSFIEVSYFKIIMEVNERARQPTDKCKFYQQTNNIFLFFYRLEDF
jgi:hypothetical protein